VGASTGAVSTTSVYADLTTPGQKADTAPVLAPTGPEIELSLPDTYGAAKVACERVFGTDAFICRPGLIVGPGDPTGRFSYWVARLKCGGEILAPATPDDPVQYIDVRDLAGWIVQAAQARLRGTFDAIGPSCTRRRFLTEGAAALDSSWTFTWVDEAFLAHHWIGGGSGSRSLPYPMPDTPGDSSRDVSAALAAGLTVRPLGETMRDTWLWLEAAGGPITGLSRDLEGLLLHDWWAAKAKGG
jgi:2'-hydroxyisoflavone reductase